jgi:hypothetical protein
MGFVFLSHREDRRIMKAPILAATAFASILAITSAAHAFFPGQEACCGPSSMYNEQNSSPLQFQEDNATGQACCGLGSQYEIDRE